MTPTLIFIAVLIGLVVAILVYGAIAALRFRRNPETGGTGREKALNRLRTERQQLMHSLEGLSEDEYFLPGQKWDWTVKDILAHLYEWEEMLMGWIAAVRRGEIPAVPAPDTTWSDLDPLNETIYKKHVDDPLESVQERFDETHRRLEALVSSMTEEELSTPGKYPWTGKVTLSDWLGAYAVHDRWARTEVLRRIKWLKKKKQPV